MTERTAMPTHSATGLLSAQGLRFDEPTPINTEIQSWTNACGTQVRFVEARGLPMVDLLLQFKAGTCQDDVYPGLAALTLYNLDEGSAGLSASEHASQLESLGAIFTKKVRLDYSALSLRSLSASHVLEPAVRLFTDLVSRPDFPAAGLEKVKGQLLAHTEQRESNPALRAIAEVYRQLFAGHPYARPEGSTAQGIAAITREDLDAFHRKAYSANNLQIALVGDLSREQAEALSLQISQALPQHWAAAELAPLPAPAPRRIHVEQPGASTVINLALPISVPANAAEYLSLILANEVLGSGLDSRLMTALRQQRGLTYDISSHLLPLTVGGLLMVQWEMAAEYVDASLAQVLRVIQELIEQGPTAAELERAHRQLSGALVRKIAQNQSLLGLLGELGYKRLPDDYLAAYLPQLGALTPEQVREVLLSNLDMALNVQVSVGPKAPQQELPEVPAGQR